MVGSGDFSGSAGRVWATRFTGKVDASWRELPPQLAGYYAQGNVSLGMEQEMFGAMRRPHAINSKHAIAETAVEGLRRAPAGMRRAIILGVGNSSDIPLPEIVSEYDHVTLVDVDPIAMERLMSCAPRAMLGKVTMRAADVAGTTGAFLKDMQTAVEQSPTFEDYIARAMPVAAAHTAQAYTPKLGEGYAFVCSQLLMSQLSALPYDYLDAVLQRKYGVVPSPFPGAAEQPYVDALNTLAQLRDTQHVAMLGGMVARTGVVHLADTYVGVSPDVGGQAVKVVDPAVVFPVIEDHFTEITPPRSWDWFAGPGTRYVVMSHSLAPRPATT